MIASTALFMSISPRFVSTTSDRISVARHCVALGFRTAGVSCSLGLIRLVSGRRDQLCLQVRCKTTHFENPADRVGKSWEGIMPVSVKDQRLS
jgi:hypothetical protein